MIAVNLTKRQLDRYMHYLGQLAPKISSSGMKAEHSLDRVILLEYQGMIFLREEA